MDILTTAKRDAVNGSPDTLLSQDFFDVIDVRTVTVGGEDIAVITKIDYDVVGASLSEISRRDEFRQKNGWLRLVGNIGNKARNNWFRPLMEA